VRGFDVERFLAELAPTRFFAYWGLTEAEARAELVDHEATDLASAVRVLFAMQARIANKPRYGDKSPPYVMHLELLAELFPEARFVQIIRDGRDVALAYRDARFGPTDVPELALHWRLRVERGRRAGRVLGPGRYREVRYEDLVSDTERVVGALCEFVKLAYDPTMLLYHQRVEDLLRTNPNPAYHASLALPPTKGLRDWRSEMLPHDVAVFELLAGGLLDDLGYERSVTRPPRRARATAAGVTLRWNARRVRKRLVARTGGD